MKTLKDTDEGLAYLCKEIEDRVHATVAEAFWWEGSEEGFDYWRERTAGAVPMTEDDWQKVRDYSGLFDED